MSSTETRLIRAAIALSVLLVAALAVLAVYSVVGPDGGDETADRAGDELDGDGSDDGQISDGGPRAFPGANVDIDDAQLPLTIGCGTTPSAGPEYTILITNRADTVVDYLVSVRLTFDDGTVLTPIEIRDLQPDDPREVVIDPQGPSGSITDCAIAAIQTDRRILQANA